jgi:RNA polymerase sigma factor (sigma-70 family)
MPVLVTATLACVSVSGVMVHAMDRDTDLGGPLCAFPATRCSVLLSANSSQPEERRQAYETLVAAYWKPVYKYLRFKWPASSNEDAKDLTQAFFTTALEKSFLARYDPAKAKFRTFLRTCVDRFVTNELKSAGRLKRGGGHNLLSLEFNKAEEEILYLRSADRTNPDQVFEQEWVRSLFGLAVEALRRHCDQTGKGVHFVLFERYELSEPEAESRLTYAQLGAELGLTAIQVTNYLAYARGQFRKLLIDQIRATTGSEEEFQMETERLLGGGRP